MNRPQGQKLKNPTLDSLIILALLAFSLYLSFKAGERGFFAFDQSIVFDGGYRVACGQIPYKDFLLPWGPVVLWVQALFFKLLGVNYFAYLAHAAVVNACATFSSILILRFLFPTEKLISYFAGLLTAVWFYPPFATPWPEQMAFFFMPRVLARAGSIK